jgi:hypothetical protein
VPGDRSLRRPLVRRLDLALEQQVVQQHRDEVCARGRGLFPEGFLLELLDGDGREERGDDVAVWMLVFG